MKNLICLVTGVISTIVFLVFAVQIYELFCYSDSKDWDAWDNWMFDNMYTIIAIVTAVISWAFAGLYYYIIDSAYFDQWYHWALILLAVLLVTCSVTYFYPMIEASDDGKDFSNSPFFLMLTLFNGIFAIVLFVIASFSIRWWSTTCKHTPIPQ